MRKFTLFFLFLAIIACGMAQTDSTFHENPPAKSFSDTVSGEPPVMFAEEMPEFPGGRDSLNVFLRRNTQWPHPLYDATGTVLVAFIVEVDGSITNPIIKEPLSPELDKEALRLIKLMPKWKPARAQGEPVRCLYTISVRFIEEGDIESTSSLLKEDIDMSQTDNTNGKDDSDGPIVDWFCYPDYEGGPDSIMTFIKRNLFIPPGYDEWTGVVLVEFVIETDGTITNPKVKVSLDPVLDAEAVKVIMSLPNKWIWKPERCYDGKIFPCFYQMPVFFGQY